jgi:dipeptidase E
MKLYLASFGIRPQLAKEFLKLVDKPAQDIKFAYITNAADPYPPNKRGWMDDVKKMFVDIGLKPKNVDLRNYSGPKILKADLSKYDVIWCGGGNTWYLRYVMRTSGFDQVIKELVTNGVVYGGDSAGAILMTPTLKYVDLIDEPEEAPERIEEGLDLVDFCIVPHWGNEKYAALLNQVRDGLVKDDYAVKTLTDEQAVIVNGKSIRVV